MSRVLEVQGLTKKFGGLTAVDHVNIHVEKGEIVGLIGANGAGKTTLFNMIAGEFPPTEGKILFNGKEIQGKPGFIANHGSLRLWHRQQSRRQSILPRQLLTLSADMASSVLNSSSRVTR